MDFRAPHEGETLSSYLAAWRGHYSVKPDVLMARIDHADPSTAVALTLDPDIPALPGWSATVASVTRLPQDALEKAGRPCGFWYLAPPARRNACLACLAEAESTAAQWRDHMWAHSTVTTCWVHDMPLVEVPAVGWEWAELPAIQRRSRRTLMHRPELHADAMNETWRRVPPHYRRAIFFAEASVWALGIGNTRFLEALHYVDDDSERVWRDLLTLLCVSWQEFSAPSLATMGMPLTLYGWNGVQRFGGRNRPVLLEEPAFSYFCALGEPSERRACLLMAMDAVRHDFSIQVLPLFGTAKFGWKKIVTGMPPRAWAWLEARSRYWPPRWRSRFLDWRRVRMDEPRSKAEARRLRDLV